MAEQRTRSTSRDAAALVAARVVSAIVSAGTWFVLINHLAPADYGSYALAVGLAGLVVICADLGLTSSLGRYIAEGSATRQTTLRVAAARLGLALLGGLGLAGFALLVSHGLLGPDHSDSGDVAALLTLGGALVIARSVVAFSAGVLPAMRRIGWLVGTTIALPVLELGGVLAALAMGGGAAGAMLAAVAAAALVGTVGLIAVVAGSPSGSSDLRFRQVGAYGLVTFLVWVSFAAFTQVDQLVIWWYDGSAAVAPYAAAWQLVTLLHLPGLAIATVLAPRLVRDADARRRLLSGIIVLLGLGIPIVVTAVALAPVGYAAILRPYVGEEGVFYALAIYAVLLTVAPLVTMAANYLGGAQRRIRVALGTLLLNAVLDIALVPVLGVYGAAIGTTIAFSWYTAAHVRLSWQLAGEHAEATPSLRGLGRVAALGIAGALVAASVARFGAAAVDTAAGPVAGLIVGAGLATAGIAATWWTLQRTFGGQWYLPPAWRVEGAAAAPLTPEDTVVRTRDLVQHEPHIRDDVEEDSA